MRKSLSFAVVGGVLGLAALGVLAQYGTPPGFENRVRQYRTATGFGEDVNQGTSRSTSTFLPVNDTNATTITYVYDTATITTNLATPIAILNGETRSITNSTTLATPIRTITVQVVWDAVSSCGGPFSVPGDTALTISLAKDSASPVILKTTTAPLPPATTIFAFAPNQVATITFDTQALNNNLSSMLNLALGNVTDSVVPETASVFDTFTNQTVSGTWIVSIKNTTTQVPPMSVNLRGFTVTVTGDPVAIVTGSGAVKDLTPRGTSEQNYKVVNPDGTTTYRLPRRATEF